MVLEAGVWWLPDGPKLQVGLTSTDATVGTRVNNRWQNVDFAHAFSTAPIVISQVQSNDDPHWVKTRQGSINATSFQIALEEESSKTTGHGVSHQVGTLNSGVAYRDGARGQGYLMFSQERVRTRFSAYPPLNQNAHHFVCVVYSGGHLNKDGVRVLVEEDTTQDSEIGHSTEVVHYLAIQDSSSSGLLTASGVSFGRGRRIINGACHGDSGGPFVVDVNGTKRLAGVIYAENCVRGESLFMNVPVYRNWIIERGVSISTFTPTPTSTPTNTPTSTPTSTFTPRIRPRPCGYVDHRGGYPCFARHETGPSETRDLALEREWQLVEINGQVIEPTNIRMNIHYLSSHAAAPYTNTFEFGGFGGTNWYSGDLYTLPGESTLQAKLGRSTFVLSNEVERAYFSGLADARTYHIVPSENGLDAKLYLYNDVKSSQCRTAQNYTIYLLKPRI